MARRRTPAGPLPAPDDDEREVLLNRLSGRLLLRLRFDDMLRDPRREPTFEGPMHDELARAMALPAGQVRRDAIETCGRRHLTDEVFERRFTYLLDRIHDATFGTHRHRPEVVDTGPPLPARVEEHDRHSPDDEHEIEC